VLNGTGGTVAKIMGLKAIQDIKIGEKIYTHYSGNGEHSPREKHTFKLGPWCLCCGIKE